MNLDRRALSAQVRALRDALDALGLLSPPADVPQVREGEAQINAQRLASALSDAAGCSRPTAARPR
ncbi:hypothetical protein MSS93_09935 [Deinococcus radiodurans]|nr:hypothetical protein MSS93_09935 [Deinococcus radiodurans]